MELKENERIDDLELNNLKIIQNKNGFCFGMDSVLLSDFAKNVKSNAKVIEFRYWYWYFTNIAFSKNECFKNYWSRNSKRSCQIRLIEAFY